MRLLLFSDIHCSKTAIENLVLLSRDVDVVVGAGDFCTMRHGLPAVMKQLAGIEKPLIAVPGNAESDHELREAANENVIVLHGGGEEVGGVKFFGLGGGVPITPFGSWSFDLDEETAEEMLADCPDNAVLVTHSPPQGAVDRSSGGHSLGSTAIRQTIVDRNPMLAVCGHIHDSSGLQEQVEDCWVVNAGPKGIIWDLENRCQVSTS